MERRADGSWSAPVPGNVIATDVVFGGPAAEAKFGAQGIARFV